MSPPLFSIVTVTLNCAGAAVRTAQSVLAQDFKDYEYIVKDGGSTDGTVARLRELALDKITVCRDGGIYDAMNQALALCAGEYVYFLNAGDTFYGSHVLSDLADRLDPGAAIVFGNLILAPLGRQSRPPTRLSRYWLFRKNLNHQAWLARLDVYKALGGFTLDYHYVADQDFLWRAILLKKLRAQYVDISLATFVYGGASTRPSVRTQVSRERWRLLHQFYAPWEIALYGVAGLYFLNPLKARIWDILHPMENC